MPESGTVQHRLAGVAQMQPRAWFFIRPDGTRHGPSFTATQARIEAARWAARRPALEAETALTLWRSLGKMGWCVKDTGTKDIRRPPPRLGGAGHRQEPRR